jgi:hyperosmotically inducible protein
MNFQKSRKIIVAGGMAAVVGIGIATFALRSHPAISVAETPLPPSPVAQAPAAMPDAAAQLPVAPPAAAQIPDAPVVAPHDDTVVSKRADTRSPPAVAAKIARNRHLADAATSVVATNGTVTRTGFAVEMGEKPAAVTFTNSVDRAMRTDEVTMPRAISRSPADDLKVATSTEFAASDSQITTDVKSEIASDSRSKGANIGVITTHGVVALTGSLASQDAIDHVRDVAGKVKDVKSVDTSALTLASL